MNPGLFQILIIALVILVRGRISEMMGDFGKGIKSFKKGIAEVDDVQNSARLDVAAEPVAEARPVSDKTAG